MFLKSISLTNFRNYTNLNLHFESPTTVLLGNNAQGKSNFLESIYFLATTKSHKADIDSELIKKGERTSFLQGTLEDEGGETKLEIAMQNEEGPRKKVKVNGIPRRVVDYIGHLLAVSFSPEDINLVTGSPSLRRWHVDITLSQMDKEYKQALTNYEDIVRNKNRILKRIKDRMGRVDELDFWVEKQLESGVVISAKRQAFFDFLNSSGRKFGEFRFEYEPSFLTVERVKEYQDRELAAATSLIGPHRDDFSFMLRDRNLAHFGSRGEHRTAVLDLKISESNFIEDKLGKRPILLLDDVFSELDIPHQEHVIALTPHQQTVIATIDLAQYLGKKLPDANFWDVEDGRLSETTGK